MNRKDCKKDRGFTILEFVVYFIITMTLLGFLFMTSLNIFQSREKVKAHQEVSRSARHAIETITEEILNAEEVIGTSD